MAEKWMSAEQWYEKFAHELGEQAPGEEQFTRILELAAEAAHASERTAAPVACWIAGRAHLPLSKAIEIAKGVTP